MDSSELQQPPVQAPVQQAAPAPMAAPRRLSFFTRGNLVMAGAIAIALVVIVFLHFQVRPSAASAAVADSEKKVDTFLKVCGSAKKDSAQAISLVESLRQENIGRQVPVSDLKANPFEFRSPMGPAINNPSPTPATATPVRSQEEMIAMERADALTLQSVITGPRGSTAMISNTLCTPGRTIQGWTVTKIQPRQVTLTWRDKQVVLRLK